MGPIFFLPLYLQSVKEATPLRSGILTLSFTISGDVSGVLTGIILSKTGHYKVLIWVGTALLTLGSGILIVLHADSSVATITGLQLLAGTAFGVLFQPVLLSIQAHAHQDDVSSATAAFGLARTLGCATSVVLGGIVFQNGMGRQTQRLVEAGGSDAVIQQFGGVNATANALLVSQIGDVRVKAAVKIAYALSLQNVWILYTSVAGAALLVSVFIVGKQLSSEHTETVTGLKEKS